MPRKTEPYKVIGYRPTKEALEAKAEGRIKGPIPEDLYEPIPEEFYKTEEWREHWFNENVIAAQAIGGRPKMTSNNTAAVH